MRRVDPKRWLRDRGWVLRRRRWVRTDRHNPAPESYTLRDAVVVQLADEHAILMQAMGL